MRKTIMVVTLWLLLLSLNVFAQDYDVSIDSDGNVTTGVANPDGNLEVTGASGEDAVVGSASGTGAAGVYGEHTTAGTADSYGILGYNDGTYNYGVFGYSPSGYAGYFDGNVYVNGTLDAGTLNITETDPTVNKLGKSGLLSCEDGQIAKYEAIGIFDWICANDIDTTLSEAEVDSFVSNNGYLTTETDPLFSVSPANTITSGQISNWNTAYGWGNHAAAGYDKTNDSWTGTGNVYTTSGNVGIGTTTPAYMLEVRGSSNTYLGYFLNDNNTSGQYAFGIYSESNAFDTLTGRGYGGLFYAYGGSTSGDAYGTFNRADAFGSSRAVGVYSVATGGSTTGREYAFYGIGDGYFSGSVGIGTETPAYILEVRGNTDTYIGYFLNDNNTSGDALGISVKADAYDTGYGWAYGAEIIGRGGISGGIAYGSMNRAYAYQGSPAFGVYSDATGGSTTGREYAFYGIGDGYFSGSVGIGTETPNNLLDLGSSVGKKLAVFQNSSGTDFYGFGISSDTLEFYSGASSTETPSMVLKKTTGNIGIGTTNPSQKLYVVGNIYATGSITPGSSRELKEDIRQLSAEEAIYALHNLTPQKFYYKADSEDEHVGFIAEDVPELVATKDRKGVSSMDVVAVLTKVVQEQQKTIAELNERLKELEKEVKLKETLASVMK